jgi:integrase
MLVAEKLSHKESPRKAQPMKELIEQWLSKQRKRTELGKLKPASLDTFTSRVNTHILPHLGELEIETIRNGVVKQFAETIAQKLGPKTTREVVALVKMILESHVTADGEPILELKWRPAFIFENVEEIGQQKQPTISKDALNAVIRNRALKVRDRVLIALAASTGLRVGEFLALKIGGGEDDSCWAPAENLIRVRKSIYRGQLQLPKTESSKRIVDLSTPVQNMLTNFADGRQPRELLFATKSGKPLEPSHVRKYIMLPNGIQGAHVLRRSRLTWLEEQGCPQGLRDAWMGHAGVGMASKYDKTAEDREFRRKQVERIGTGLEIASAIAPQIVKSGDPRPQNTKAAKPRRKDPKPSKPVYEEPAQPEFVAQDSDLDPLFFEQPAPTPTQEELEAELARLEELRAILNGVN